MAFKNRKANYPLYETTVLKDIRDLVENAANNFPDRNALTYKKNPHGARHTVFYGGCSFICLKTISTKKIKELKEKGYI